jgi:transposase
MWSVSALEISVEERLELARRVRAQTTPQRMVRRCRVVLMAAEGVPSRRIAPEVGMSEQYVGMWRRWFAADRLVGLEDRPRSGRPRVYGHDERVKVVARAASAPPAHVSHWSHDLLARDMAAMGISASHVRDIGSVDLPRGRGPRVAWSSRLVGGGWRRDRLWGRSVRAWPR